jgi:hypothetical protein
MQSSDDIIQWVPEAWLDRLAARSYRFQFLQDHAFLLGSGLLGWASVRQWQLNLASSIVNRCLHWFWHTSGAFSRLSEDSNSFIGLTVAAVNRERMEAGLRTASLLLPDWAKDGAVVTPTLLAAVGMAGAVSYGIVKMIPDRWKKFIPAEVDRAARQGHNVLVATRHYATSVDRETWQHRLASRIVPATADIIANALYGQVLRCMGLQMPRAATLLDSEVQNASPDPHN